MKHGWIITSVLIALFLLSQLVGLKVIDNYVDKKAGPGVVSYKDLPYSIERPDIAPGMSVWFILLAVLIGTVFLLLLIRFRKIGLWRIWFLLSVLLTLSIAFSSFIPSTVAFGLALALSLWKVFRPNVVVHNLTEVFIYGGLAAIFVPILNLAAVIILLLVISSYDIFAVWQSRHMVKMANFQTASNLFSGIYIPGKGGGRLPRARSDSSRSTVSSAVLGGGDMGFPLIFSGVAMKYVGFPDVLFVTLFASAALVALLLFAQKNRFYPAMPFLSAGCLIGYAFAAYVF
ncbi:hypothetical protein HYU11_01295 [Candidatus Woesearchaeota archaeon]|nr:hypothetical protein [Candidatus Woesearchaeota archaeon]